MEFYYLFQNRIVIYNEDLNIIQDVGKTWSESNDKFVSLSNEQVQFFKQHPNASALDVWNMYLKDDDLEHIRKNKIMEIRAYDTSSEVNIFRVQHFDMWLSRDLRVSIKASVEAAKMKGKEEHTLWYESVPFSLPVDTFLKLLCEIELYASECFNATARHMLNVNSLTSIEEINTYDFRIDYPEKIIITL